MDNIITNDVTNKLNDAILVDISDHFPVCNVCHHKMKEKRYVINKKQCTDSNISEFSKLLQNVRWKLKSSDGNVCYSFFLSTFIRIYEEYFPLQEVNINI